MIRNLIFDFGKVLVDYDFEAFFHKHIPDPDRCRAFMPIMCNDHIQHLMDREECPVQETLDMLIRQHPEYEYEIQLFISHYPDIVTGEIEGMRELLTRLKAEGFRLYGLTNWCSMVHQTIEEYPIFRLLDGYIISSEEKVVKPEPEIYERLFSKYDLKPEECLFTDDREDNVIGAEQVGMAGIIFHDAQQYERQLREYLIHPHR